LRGSQRDVQDRAPLGEINGVTSKHRVDLRSQARFLNELHQELEGFLRDAILRVIQEQPRSLGRHPLTALRVLLKELS
jgi:hypothetical protein